MNKKQFASTAKALTDIASSFGAKVELDVDALVVRFAEVSCTVFIDEGPIGLHMHGAQRPLAPELFDSTSRTKATWHSSNWPLFLIGFRRRCAAVADGTVFA